MQDKKNLFSQCNESLRRQNREIRENAYNYYQSNSQTREGDSCANGIDTNSFHLVILQNIKMTMGMIY